MHVLLDREGVTCCNICVAWKRAGLSALKCRLLGLGGRACDGADFHACIRMWQRTMLVLLGWSPATLHPSNGHITCGVVLLLPLSVYSELARMTAAHATLDCY
jgi:hypothetical protein